MPSKSPFRFVTAALALLFILLVLAAPSLSAQEQPGQEEEQPAPPPAGCLGSNDPWCEGAGGGDDGGFDYDCSTCEWIPEGPNGEPSFYACVVDNGCCNSELRECRDGLYTCYYDGYCVYT